MKTNHPTHKFETEDGCQTDHCVSCGVEEYELGSDLPCHGDCFCGGLQDQ